MSAQDDDDRLPIDRKPIDRLLVAFEQTARRDESGQQYWLAREYQVLLGYTGWRRFEGVIDRAKAALMHEGGVVVDHFDNVVKMVAVGSGAERSVDDYRLSRRACYLIAINGDPKKKAAIAAAQKYFVEQTRKQELREILELAASDADRIAARRKLEMTEREFEIEVSPRVTRTEHVDQIKRRGQEALFQRSPEKVKEDLGIPSDREIADFARPVIVKGMDFATELTTEQVRADPKPTGVRKIGTVNAENHAEVRGMMTDRGLFPERLPPAGDIGEIEQRLDRQRTKLVRRSSE
ncbi:MAG: hypothetical protein ACREC6_00275 [Hyphomicrobiaceae bacterium]